MQGDIGDRAEELGKRFKAICSCDPVKARTVWQFDLEGVLASLRLASAARYRDRAWRHLRAAETILTRIENNS